ADLFALSVGRVAFGNGLAGGLLRAAAVVAAAADGAAAGARDALAAPVAPVSTDVLLGPGQAYKRRPDLARVDGHAIPLRDPAAAAVDRVVHAPAPGLVAKRVGPVYVRCGIGVAVSDLRPTPGAAGDLRGLRGPATAHHRHRQLRLLQPAVDHAVRTAPG